MEQPNDMNVKSINGASGNVYNKTSKNAMNRITVPAPGGRPKQKGQRKNSVTPQMVKNMINLKMDQNFEKKWFGKSYSPTGVDNAGTINTLSDITQGLLDTNRVGDQVNPDRLRLSYSVNVGDSTNIVRMIIFQWRLMSTPTLASILQYSTVAEVPYAPTTIDTASDYKILYDRTCYVSTNQAICGDVIEINLKGKIQYQSGGTSAINQIWIALVSDSGAAPNPTVGYVSALYFYDA